MDDLQGMLDDAGRHKLLTAVAPLAHQGARQALRDGALRNDSNNSPRVARNEAGAEDRIRDTYDGTIGTGRQN